MKKREGPPTLDGTGVIQQTTRTPSMKKKRPHNKHKKTEPNRQLRHARKDALTPKQLGFIESYLKNGHNASQAYRDNYSVVNMTEASIGRKAFDALHHVKVSAKIKEVEDLALKEATRKVAYTMEQHLAELEEIRVLGVAKGRNLAAAAKATELKGKVNKFYTDRVELSGPNGSPLQVQPVPVFDLSKLTDEEIDLLYKLLEKLQKEP